MSERLVEERRFPLKKTRTAFVDLKAVAWSTDEQVWRELAPRTYTSLRLAFGDSYADIWGEGPYHSLAKYPQAQEPTFFRTPFTVKTEGSKHGDMILEGLVNIRLEVDEKSKYEFQEFWYLNPPKENVYVIVDFAFVGDVFSDDESVGSIREIASYEFHLRWYRGTALPLHAGRAEFKRFLSEGQKVVDRVVAELTEMEEKFVIFPPEHLAPL